MTLYEAIEILKKVQTCSDMVCGRELSCEGEVELSCEGCPHEYTTEDFFKAICTITSHFENVDSNGETTQGYHEESEIK